MWKVPLVLAPLLTSVLLVLLEQEYRWFSRLLNPVPFVFFGSLLLLRVDLKRKRPKGRTTLSLFILTLVIGSDGILGLCRSVVSGVSFAVAGEMPSPVPGEDPFPGFIDVMGPYALWLFQLFLLYEAISAGLGQRRFGAVPYLIHLASALVWGNFDDAPTAHERSTLFCGLTFTLVCASWTWLSPKKRSSHRYLTSIAWFLFAAPIAALAAFSIRVGQEYDGSCSGFTDGSSPCSFGEYMLKEMVFLLLFGTPAWGAWVITLSALCGLSREAKRSLSEVPVENEPRRLVHVVAVAVLGMLLCTWIVPKRGTLTRQLHPDRSQQISIPQEFDLFETGSTEMFQRFVERSARSSLWFLRPARLSQIKQPIYELILRTEILREISSGSVPADRRVRMIKIPPVIMSVSLHPGAVMPRDTFDSLKIAYRFGTFVEPGQREVAIHFRPDDDDNGLGDLHHVMVFRANHALVQIQERCAQSCGALTQLALQTLAQDLKHAQEGTVYTALPPRSVISSSEDSYRMVLEAVADDSGGGRVLNWFLEGHVNYGHLGALRAHIGLPHVVEQAPSPWEVPMEEIVSGSENERERYWFRMPLNVGRDLPITLTVRKLDGESKKVVAHFCVRDSFESPNLEQCKE